MVIGLRSQLCSVGALAMLLFWRLVIEKEKLNLAVAREWFDIKLLFVGLQNTAAISYDRVHAANTDALKKCNVQISRKLLRLDIHQHDHSEFV